MYGVNVFLKFCLEAIILRSICRIVFNSSRYKKTLQDNHKTRYSGNSGFTKDSVPLLARGNCKEYEMKSFRPKKDIKFCFTSLSNVVKRKIVVYEDEGLEENC